MAAFAPAAAMASPFRTMRRWVPLSEMTCSDFIQMLNMMFLVSDGGSPVAALQLVEVSQPPMSLLQRHSPDAANEKFVLRLRGSPDQRLGQNTYRCENSVLGGFDMFIVPLFSLDPASNEYEAIFNRPPVRKTQIMR
jgi:hypothetical protein